MRNGTRAAQAQRVMTLHSALTEPSSRFTRLCLACVLGCVAAAGSCGDDEPTAVRGPKDLLRADVFRSLVFELDTVVGAEPSAAVAERVRTQTVTLVDKPEGVVVFHDQSLPADSNRVWTDEQLHALAEQTESPDSAAGQAGVHVLAVDGHSANDGDGRITLGTSWGSHSIVLFEQTIRQACAAGQLKVSTVSDFCEECEALVWLHEFGHLLGLVGAIPMIEDHQDPDHPVHDKNPDCLMHWLFHNASAVDKLRSRYNAGELQPVGFDRQCRDDLRAVREGLSP